MTDREDAEASIMERSFIVFAIEALGRETWPMLLWNRRPTENRCLLNGTFGTCTFDEALQTVREHQPPSRVFQPSDDGRKTIGRVSTVSFRISWVWRYSNTLPKLVVHPGPNCLGDGYGNHCPSPAWIQRSLWLQKSIFFGQSSSCHDPSSSLKKSWSDSSRWSGFEVNRLIFSYYQAPSWDRLQRACLLRSLKTVSRS